MIELSFRGLTNKKKPSCFQEGFAVKIQGLFLPKQKCLPDEGGMMGMLLGLSAGGQNKVLHNGYTLQDEIGFVKRVCKKLADNTGVSAEKSTLIRQIVKNKTHGVAEESVCLINLYH